MGFRDTFTKDESKEGQLGYDDTAFYYFLASVLICVAGPWSLSVVYNLLFAEKVQHEKDFPKKNNKTGSTYRYCQTSVMVSKVAEARQDSRRKSRGSFFITIIKFAVIAAIWGGIYLIMIFVGSEKKEISHFDPFDILEVEYSATNPEIKKAYRKLSLIYHPDKNPDDPLAANKFIQITKAYAALTDEVAKRNWEKFGNPDGPTTTKVGIGLPVFLLEKDNHFMILCAFFFVLIFLVPGTFICYYQRTKGYAANGVMVDTLQFLGYYINEATRSKNCPELLGAAAECRAIGTRATDNLDLKPLMSQVVEHKKHQFSLPVILKNQYILWAHMQRLHSAMSPALRADCDRMLTHSMRITQAMIEVACMREWFFTAQSLIEFRRCMVQALDVKSSELLQIPHFDEEILKHCHRGKNSVSTLSQFLGKDPEQRKGLSKMESHQLADIEAFCAHASAPELKAIVEVEDEPEIVVGDVATVTVNLERMNLREGEAIGPVHAPFFPEPKYEEWWLFLVEGQGKEGGSIRIIAFERVRDTERVVETKMRFQLTRPGKHTLTLHAICDSYAGVDQKVDLNFNVLQENEVKREIHIHPEDEDLDLQPTLFQQFMGELGREEESEEEDEAKPAKKGKAAASKPKKEKASTNNEDAEDSDGDAANDKKKEDDDDGSSDSSSDSE